MKDGDDIKVLGGFLPNGKCVSVSLEPLSPKRMKDLEERGATVRLATIAECRQAASCSGFKRSIAMLKRAAITRQAEPLYFVICETNQGPVFRCFKRGMATSYWYSLQPVFDIESTEEWLSFDVRALPSPYDAIAKAAGDPSLEVLQSREAFHQHIFAEENAHRRAIQAFVDGGGSLTDEIRRQEQVCNEQPPLVQGPIQEDIPF